MTINSYLNDLAQRAIVRDDEKTKISISKNAIIKRLMDYFQNHIETPILFGSYTRKTIISRQFDDNSDIDIMICFKYITPYQPQTYLNYLKDFAIQCYPKSQIYQSFPTIVLELNHIKFDLVPAIERIDALCIPDKNFNWLKTNPNDLNIHLTNNQNLRRLIRIAKIWNAKQGNLFPSYELEKFIVLKRFNYSNCHDLYSHFYRFSQLLQTSFNYTDNINNKIKNLKDTMSVIEQLAIDNADMIINLFE